MKKIKYRGKINESDNEDDLIEGFLIIKDEIFFIVFCFKSLIFQKEVIPESIEVQTDSGEWKSINDIKIT